MLPDRDAGASALPEHWLAVLDAVADACTVERANSAPTGRVHARARDLNGKKVRTLLRLLRRRGYVCTTGDSVAGAQLRSSLTSAGPAASPNNHPHQAGNLTTAGTVSQLLTALEDALTPLLRQTSALMGK